MNRPDDAELDLVPEPVGKLGAISIDCPDPHRLSDFYANLLGMARVLVTPDDNVVVISDGTATIALMRVAHYVAPTWPEAGQTQQMHLDISVVDLAAAVASAERLGARQADHQPDPAAWRVLLDPVGHPFCLTTVGAG